MEKEIEQDEKMLPMDSRTMFIAWIGKVMVMSGKCYAVLVSISSGLDPKFPTNVFAIYWPDVANLDGTTMTMLHRIVTMVVNLVAWHLISYCGVLTCIEMLVSMEAVRVYQLSLLNYTKASRSIDTWEKIKQMYSRLRLLTQMFNEVHANGIIVHLLIFTSVSQIVSVYSVIRCGGLPLPILTTLLFIGFDTYIVVIGVYAGAGEVNKTSKENVLRSKIFVENQETLHLFWQHHPEGLSSIMVLKKGLIVPVQQAIQMDSWFQITPFQWDGPNSQFKIKNTTSSQAWRIIAYIYFCVTGNLMLFSCILNSSSYTTAERSQTVVTAVLFHFCGSVLKTQHTEHLSIISVLNGLLKMEEEIEHDRRMHPKDFRTLLIKWIGKLIVTSGKCYPVLVSIGSGFDPKFPTNALAIYWPDTENLDGGTILTLLHRFVTMVVNLVVWHLITYCGIMTVNEMLVSMEAVLVYQLSLLNYTKVSRSIDTWVKVKHMYSRLRLLIQRFNDVHANGILVHILLLISVSQIVSVYSLIRCGGLQYPILITLLFISFDSYITLIGVFGSAGEVNQTSREVTVGLRRKGFKVKSIMVQKMMKAFPDLRIGFGSVNFIEVTTPLQFLNFNNLRIVDLLLFNRK
ncbi:unnamed protein product [Orchesella dallaii]|uniref:Uncharacterized protein n=1 Tax=Orchesella dallaii TaxID=48710 RepID=A0ABP1R9T3_9HEXA